MNITTRFRERTRSLCLPAPALIACGICSVAGGTEDHFRSNIADLTFADLAPAESILVIATDDATALMEHLSEGGLGDLWRDETIQAFMEKPLETFFDEVHSELGVELSLEDIRFPTGFAGFALFEVEDPEEDEEDEFLPPWMQDEPDHYGLFATDFGENIEWASETFTEIWDHVKDDEDSDTIYEEEDFEDWTIFIVRPPEVNREEIIAEIKREWAERIEIEEWTEDDLIDYLEEYGYFDQDFDPFHVVFADNLLLGTDHRPTLDRLLLNLAAGETGGEDSMAGSETMHATLNMGESRSDVYGVFLIDSFFDPMLSMILFDMVGGDDDYDPTGFTRLKAISWMVDFDVEDAIGTATGTLYMPDGPTGILELVEPTEDGLSAPDFASPDMTSLLRLNFNFKGVIEVIRRALQLIPEEMRAGAIQSFEDQAAGILTTIFDVLGPQVHILSGTADPYDEDELLAPMLIAIETSDALLVQNALAQWLAQIGLEPTDFLGHRIFAPPAEDEMALFPFAFGFGKDQVFIGRIDQVEQSLRADEATPNMGDEPSFETAVNQVPGNNIATLFSLTRPAIEAWVRELEFPFDEAAQAKRVEQLRTQYEEWGIEFDEEYFAVEKPEWYDPDLIPSAEVFLKYIGDAFGYIEQTPEGFIYRSSVMLPVEEN